MDKPVKLEWWHVALLRALDGPGARSAADLGRDVWDSGTPRSCAAIATPALKAMERNGLVGRLDDIRPVAWFRTRAGTAELAGRAHPAAATA